jgi:integrase
VASVEKLGSGKWRVRWRDPDGRARSRRVSTARAAQQLQREVELARDLGRRWEPAPLHSTGLDELLRAYLIDRKAIRAESTLGVMAAQLEVFRRFLRHEQPRGRLWPDMLSRQLLADYYAWLGRSDTTRPHIAQRSDVTRRGYLHAAQAFWRWLDNHDDYCDLVPRAKSLAFARPASGRPVLAPTWPEVDQMIAACQSEEARRFAVLLRFTGLRAGQAVRLEWTDVDLDRALLTIRGELGKSVGERAGRIMPLAGALVTELATWGSREGRLFQWTSRSMVTLRVRQAWEASGVREEVWKRRPCHSLRKAFRSGLLSMGANSDAIEYLVGHMEGSRWTYTDAMAALPLRETVDMVPAVGDAGASCVRLVSGVRRES